MAEVTSNTPSMPAPAPPGAGVASGSADPKAELNRLKDLVQANQAQIDQMTKASSSYQQDISVLQSGLNEVDQVVKAYDQGIKAIGDQTSLRTFVDQKRNMAVAAVGASKPALDAIVAGYDADIQDRGKSLAALQAATEQARSAHATALQAANAKQAAYSDAKATLSRVQAGVNDIKNLKTQLGSASDSGDFGSMYFLVGEMGSALNALTVPTPADLQARLSTALLELKAALSDVRNKKEAADKAKAAQAVAQKKLDDSKAGRRATLLEAVKKMKTTAPQPPATAAPQPAATAAPQPAAPTAPQPAAPTAPQPAAPTAPHPAPPTA